jgi:hypothetical protein
MLAARKFRKELTGFDCTWHDDADRSSGIEYQFATFGGG